MEQMCLMGPAPVQLEMPTDHHKYVVYITKTVTFDTSIIVEAGSAQEAADLVADGHGESDEDDRGGEIIDIHVVTDLETLADCDFTNPFDED